VSLVVGQLGDKGGGQEAKNDLGPLADTAPLPTLYVWTIVAWQRWRSGAGRGEGVGGRGVGQVRG
jgi:hypothetical protein